MAKLSNNTLLLLVIVLVVIVTFVMYNNNNKNEDFIGLPAVCKPECTPEQQCINVVGSTSECYPKSQCDNNNPCPSGYYCDVSSYMTPEYKKCWKEGEMGL